MEVVAGEDSWSSRSRDDAEDALRRVYDGSQEVPLMDDLMLGALPVGDVARDREHLVAAALDHPDLAIADAAALLEDLQLERVGLRERAQEPHEARGDHQRAGACGCPASVPGRRARCR